MKIKPLKKTNNFVNMSYYELNYNHVSQLYRLLFFTVPYGSWFAHVKNYWEMRHRSNFLFITYEDLKKVRNDRKGTDWGL